MDEAFADPATLRGVAKAMSYFLRSEAADALTNEERQQVESAGTLAKRGDSKSLSSTLENMANSVTIATAMKGFIVDYGPMLLAGAKAVLSMMFGV